MVKTRKDNHEPEEPVYVLKDITRGIVWHEQFTSREMAQGCIDHHRNKGEVGNWEIIKVGKNNG